MFYIGWFVISKPSACHCLLTYICFLGEIAKFRYETEGHMIDVTPEKAFDTLFYPLITFETRFLTDPSLLFVQPSSEVLASFTAWAETGPTDPNERMYCPSHLKMEYSLITSG